MKLDLDVDTPEEVIEVLLKASEVYYETAELLHETWQTPVAGKIWKYIAREFEKLANRIEERL